MNLSPADLGACWIWHKENINEVNQYIEFRHEFIIENEDLKDAKLLISVDTEYALWINGVFVDFNQYDDYPANKSYDELFVGKFLKEGSNILCISAYYQGEDSWQYIKGQPGIIYSLNVGEKLYISDENVFCRRSRVYRNGCMPKYTPMISFTFEYDASNEDDWLKENYIMKEEWKSARVDRERTTSLYKRPVKKQILKDRTKTRIAGQGVYMREDSPECTVAQAMQHDFLSSRTAEDVFIGLSSMELSSNEEIHINPALFSGNKGVYIVFDLAREEAGQLDIEIEADCGTVIDISFGEHLDDLRVRAHVGGRNFASRYICGKGRRRFTHYFRRFGCRYLQLHISGVNEKFILYYAGIIPCEYPVELKGEFMCPDFLHSKIYETSVRTLELCMHEHYEDTPWREQALYSMDSRNQALCGYYSFGEYEFPEASFRLLGDGLGDDGYINCIAPTRENMIFKIPCFSMAWIIEVAEHLLYSGNFNAAKDALPKVGKMLDAYTNSLKDGLMPCPTGAGYWHFYEWSEGMDGVSDEDVPAPLSSNEILTTERYDAPLNLFLYLALDSAAEMTQACGDANTANKYRLYADLIKNTFHKAFWDNEKLAYRTYVGEGAKIHFSELTQALALCAGICPEAKDMQLREKISSANNGLVETTLSHSIYKFEALMQEPEKYGKIVFDKIAHDWGHMLFNGATSFWETIKGASDFSNAGSLCHGWSAIPIYFYHAYILGIKPAKPGFKSFKARPVHSVFHRAEGIVPTPYGNISVKWESQGEKNNIDLLYPENIMECE